jgi:hypothetical protein
VVTGATEDRGQGIVETRDFRGAAVVARGDESHICRDFLIDVTAIGTGSDDAVEEAETT